MDIIYPLFYYDCDSVVISQNIEIINKLNQPLILDK